MFYVYLPTSWCKRFGISSASKVYVDFDDKNNLIVSPKISEKKHKHLEFSTVETELEVINKLIVACYLNPLGSFKINIPKKVDYTQLLNQKRLISLELVEFNKDSITCDSSVSISDPLALLTTMARKIRNLIVIMIKRPDKELIDKYEEEIDRNNILIEKSVLAAFSNIGQSSIKTIDLHFISLISRYLERVVDYLTAMEKIDEKYLVMLEKSIEKISIIIENITKKQVSIDSSVELTKQIIQLPGEKKEEDRIKRNMTHIAEVVMDWVISKQANT